MDLYRPDHDGARQCGQSGIPEGDAIPEDDWDRWNLSRDRSQTNNSAQYVPPGVYGTGDLDAAGTWIYVAPYGYVWRPTGVGVGWAPYRRGRWSWIDWYGWTWVGCEPWGWAPYHYGRWFWGANYGWLWYPGVLGVGTIGLRRWWDFSDLAAALASASASDLVMSAGWHWRLSKCSTRGGAGAIMAQAASTGALTAPT